MTDRELLKLAAKAAGIDYRPQYDLVKTSIGWDAWNPLTDDGDALRLAVTLGLRIKIEKEDHVEVDQGESKPICWQAVTTSRDIYHCTRRAIVREAAEIGKGMQ